MKRNLATTEIIIKFLGLDLSNLKWYTSHRKKKKGEMSIVYVESSSKVLSNINLTGIEQDYSKIIDEGFMSLTSGSMKML